MYQVHPIKIRLGWAQGLGLLAVRRVGKGGNIFSVYIIYCGIKLLVLSCVVGCAVLKTWTHQMFLKNVIWGASFVSPEFGP